MVNLTPAKSLKFPGIWGLRSTYLTSKSDFNSHLSPSYRDFNADQADSKPDRVEYLKRMYSANRQPDRIRNQRNWICMRWPDYTPDRADIYLHGPIEN